MLIVIIRLCSSISSFFFFLFFFFFFFNDTATTEIYTLSPRRSSDLVNASTVGRVREVVPVVTDVDAVRIENVRSLLIGDRSELAENETENGSDERASENGGDETVEADAGCLCGSDLRMSRQRSDCEYRGEQNCRRQ